MRKIVFLLIVGAFAGACLAPACASPWAREKGRLFLSSRANYFVSTGDAPLPEATEPPRFERIDSDVYAEFGLNSRLSVGGKVIYGNAAFFDGFSTASVSGFAEIEGHIQHTILRSRRHALSVKLAAATPTRFENGGRPGVFSDGVDAELRALYGRNMIRRPVKIYASVEAGYRRRFGDGADQIRADALIGVEPLKSVLVLAEVLSRTSVRNESPGGADYDVLILQPSAVWRFSKRMGVQAGLTHEAVGRNLVRGDGYFLALWTEF